MEINWMTIGTTIATSAITAVIFTGGTNLLLQKTNRKGNLLTEKGTSIIKDTLDLSELRNSTTFYCSFFVGFSDGELRKAFDKYSKSCEDFKKIIQAYDFQ